MSADSYKYGWRRSALLKGTFEGDTSGIDYTVWKLGDAPGPWVYVVSAVGSGRLKIGFTTGRLLDRMKGLETGCPFPTKVLAIMRGDRELEQDLHKELAAYRRHLEWFEDTPEIRSVLRELAIKLRGVAWGMDQRLSDSLRSQHIGEASLSDDSRLALVDAGEK